MKKPVAEVSDHAILRYLEKAWGVDVEGLRRRIGRQADQAIGLGASGVTTNGVRIVLRGPRVVTVLAIARRKRRPM